jgi:hypothetical protein
MSGSYSVGDINVDTFLFVSQRGTLDMSTSFVSASIYESILVPGTVCDVVIVDTQDQLGTLVLAGDEMVIISFKVLGSVTANYIFSVHELAELTSVGAQRGKSYTLKCVSEEAMHAKTNYIIKSYKMLCSQMIKDVHEKYLRSGKPITIEDTMSPQKILIQNEGPYAAIRRIRSLSVSSSNRSSSYVYFENRKNEQQAYNYVTIEKLFQNAPVKSFQQSDALNTNALIRNDNNILAYKLPTQFSSIDRLIYGGPRRITTKNLTTQEYETRVVQTTDLSGRDGGSGTLVSTALANTYFNSRNPPPSHGVIDYYRPATNIPENQPQQQAYIADLLQNSIKIRVPGDTILTAGAMINCTIPNKNGFTGPRTEDDLISGKFLIARIHHKIGAFGEQPRYTCIIECLKGKYNEGVQ